MERPILFSAPMVIANREGRKTQTRRTRGLDKINEAPDEWQYVGVTDRGEGDEHRFIHAGSHYIRCPFGVAGDRLWVRESFWWNNNLPESSHSCAYRADGKFPIHLADEKWTPSIHMPRWASRDTLEVVSVRPERLQVITREDAIAEGIQVLPLQNANDPSAWWQSAPGETQERSPEASFRAIWESINGPGSWEKNPWVWRLEYKRLPQ